MKVSVLELRPTQFVLGMKEVDFKVGLMQGLKGAKLSDYVEDHPVPCVVGPSGALYMIDHHHFVAASWRLGFKKIRALQVADCRDLDQPSFWTLMGEKRWVYLYDQFDHGPHDPSELPLDIRGLSDDLYRSLAWELRRAGVIAKEQEPFAEFRWAKLLRGVLKVDLHTNSYEQVVKEAIAVARDQLGAAAVANKS